MAETLIAVAVVAVTEAYKRVRDGDWKAVVTIAVAAVAGVLAGVFEIGGITSVEDGLVAGLAAVGIHQVARQIR